MLPFQDYIDNAKLIEDDLEAIQAVTADVADALDAVEAFLGTPATISSALNTANNALSLPGPIINLLEKIPFGIGAAVKAFETTATGLKSSIVASKKTIDQIDTKLDPVRDAVDDGRNAISVAAATVTIASTAFLVVEDEAARLQASLGSQEFYLGGSFRLPAQFRGFNEAVDEYTALRDAVLSGISDVAALVEDAANAIDAALAPLVGPASGLKNALNAVFKPITDFLNTIEDTLDFEVNTFIFGKFNVLDVLTGVVNVAGNVFDVIIDAVTGLFGIDLGGLGDDLQALVNKLVAPFNPVSKLINDLEDDFNALLADLTDPLNEAVGDLLDLTRELQDAVDLGILFENSVVGDEAPDLVWFADTLSGTDGVSDAIYGLRGNDILTGGEDDFVFGGNGRDMINVEGARVEAYGGNGRDRIMVTADESNFRADGGAGNDIMIGGDRSDTFFGNTGNDIMLGGGGADIFYFTGELGNDRVFGGEDIYQDAHFIDTALTGGAPLTLEVFEAEYAAVQGNRIVVTFDNESTVTFFGVTDVARLFDTIIDDGGFDAFA